MADDGHLSIILEAKIDKLTEALSRANGQVVSFSQRGQRAFDELRAQVDPVGLAADRMARSIAVADKALAASKITAAQHAQALGLAKKAYEDVKKAVDDAAKGIQQIGGFNRAQIAELTHSGKAMFDMIAAGQSPLRAAQVEAARLGQALSSGEGGLAGGFRNLAALAFTPIAGLVAFGAALLALVGIEQKFESQQRTTQTVLRGYGAASGAGVRDIEAIAEAAAGAGQATHDLAVQAEQAFLKAGAAKDQLAPGVAVLKDFAALAGQDTPEALKTLAGAYSDPKKFADEFGGSLLNLTAAQIEQIHQLVEMGDKAQATAALLRDIGAASRGAGDELKTGLGRAIDYLKDQFSDFIAVLGQGLAGLTQKLPAAAELANLQRQRAQIVQAAAPRTILGMSNILGIPVRPLSGSTTADTTDVDRRIAAVQARIAQDEARAAPARAAAAAAKQGRDAQALVDAANPDAKRLRELRARGAGLRSDLGNLGSGGPSRADVEAAIKANDKAITDLQNKGVKKSRAARTGPADQTAQFDATATQALDRAQQGYLQSLLALTVDLRERADIEKQGIDAGLTKQLDALSADEVKVRASKNDAHRAEQIATLEAAKTKAREAAENQKELIDRQAAVALAQEELRQRQKIDGYYNEIASINVSLAHTARERLALELTDLAERKRQSDRARAATRDDALTLARTPGDRQKAEKNYAEEQASANDLYAKQIEQVRRANMSPLEAWRDQSLRTAAQIEEAYESVAARGLDALTSGITDAITGTKSLGDAFKEVANGIIADLVRIAVQRSITQPLANALFGGASSGALFNSAGQDISAAFNVSSSGGGGLGGFFSNLLKLGSGHANGGPVSPGTAYPVGERGRELFVPNQAGQIISNDVLRSVARAPAARASSPNIAISYAPSYSVTGSGPELDRLRADMAADRASFGARAASAVQDGLRRGAIRTARG